MSNFTSYVHLAQVYDQLMADAPYSAWLRFAEATWERYGVKPGHVLDLACGTGALSILLGQAGYRVTGVDLSAEMLAVTDQKAKEQGMKLDLLHQDMRNLVLPYQVDSVICFCDSLNYLKEPADVQAAFRQVYQFLVPGGTFLFDVHSLYKMERVFADHTFTLTDEDISYIWDCEWDGTKVIHDLVIFVKEGDLYRRFDEVHEQRWFSSEEITEWLSRAGFGQIVTTADFGFAAPADTSERIFFSARKGVGG